MPLDTGENDTTYSRYQPYAKVLSKMGYRKIKTD